MRFHRKHRLLSILFCSAFILSSVLGQISVAEEAPAPSKVVPQVSSGRNSTTLVQPATKGEGTGRAADSVSSGAAEESANDASGPADSTRKLKGAIAPQSQRQNNLPQSANSEQLPANFFVRLSSPEGFTRSLPDVLETEAESNLDTLEQLLPPARFPVPVAKEEIRGVWMTTSDMAVLRDPDALGFALKKLARLNFNTIYPVVWNGGYTLHPSEVAGRVGIPEVYRGTQQQDILENIIEQAHREGISVVPWFEYGLMTPPESELARAHPEWLTQKRNGGQTSKVSGTNMVWLNPLRPEVRQFLTALVTEVVAKYDVDGIQFDDHMSLPYEFGYDSYTLAAYEREAGHAAPKNPSNEAWVRWRAGNITSLIGEIHSAVKRNQPDALFSVSPNAYRYAYSRQLQDWLTWMRKGYVDELIVQVYRSDLRGFIKHLEKPEVREAQRTIATGIGVLTGLTRRPVSSKQIQKQVKAAQQRGLGVSFFFYRSLWDDAPEPMEERLALFQSLFPRQSLRLARR